MGQIPDSNAGKPPALMTQAAYAKRRGVSAMAVSRAVKRGRLRDSLAHDAAGKVIGIRDPELADREWAANTDLTEAPVAVLEKAAARQESESAPESGLLTMSEASTAEKRWKARLAELQFKEQAAELVPAKDAVRAWQGHITAAKTRLLGIPSRAKQQAPHLTIADLAMIEALIREALEELAT